MKLSKERRDVEELKEVLKLVREEVPSLLREITGPLRDFIGISLSEEQARERARSIAVFYNELIKGGIKEEVALKMVEAQFISPVSLIRNLVESRLGEKRLKKEERVEK